MTAPVGLPRRDALVARAVLGLVALQAVPPVLIAWCGYGPTAAADSSVVAVSSPVLLGVAAFGAVIAVALNQPGLEPAGGPLGGPVHERGALAAPCGATEPIELADLHGPVRPGAPTSTVRPPLRWAGLATLLAITVTAAALVVDSGVSGGAASLTHAMDDGSAAWTFVLLVVQGGFIELRAPVAFAVAWFVLARASRPVSPRERSPSPRWPAARTRRRSQGGPSS